MCSITELECSLQYGAEHIEKNGAFFSDKIRGNQQLFIDREKQLTIALTFLARVEVDASWPWQIL